MFDRNTYRKNVGDLTMLLFIKGTTSPNKPLVHSLQKKLYLECINELLIVRTFLFVHFVFYTIKRYFLVIHTFETQVFLSFKKQEHIYPLY